MHIKKPFTVLHNLKRLICVFRPFSSSLSTLLIFSLLTKRQHSLCIVPGGIAKCTVTENLVKSAWSNFKICVFWYGKKRNERSAAQFCTEVPLWAGAQRQESSSVLVITNPTNLLCFRSLKIERKKRRSMPAPHHTY